MELYPYHAPFACDSWTVIGSVSLCGIITVKLLLMELIRYHAEKLHQKTYVQLSFPTVKVVANAPLVSIQKVFLILL